MAYTIEIHRHGAGKQPVATLRATDFAYVHSTAGGSNFNVTAKDYLAQHFNSVRVGDWAVVRRSGATAVAFGHVDTVSGGVQVKSGAVVATKPFRVGCSSWFNFLGKCRLYVPLGFSDTVGTSMSVQDWSLAAAAVFTEYATGSIGVALARLHKLIGRVRLPESLGGELLGDAIPVVHDSETQARWAPQRVIDPVNVANGIMGGLNFTFQDSSIQELYYGSFVPDPRLIEMFPSLEVAPEQADSSRGWAGTGPEYLPLPALARILGVTPVLIYRLRPWRARPLIEAVDALDYDINPDAIADVPLRQQAAPNMSTTQGDQHVTADPALEGAAQLRAIAQGQTRLAESLTWKYRQLNLLGEFQNGKPPLFSTVTWDTRRAIEIPASIIDDIDLNWDDERRVNEVAINLSTDPGTGAEAIRSMGLPLVNEESVINHGTRLAKPVWPFVLPRLGDNNWIPYMRSVACQLMQFQQAAHLMANGTISIRWPDAEVRDESGGQTTLRTQLPALVGEMVSVALEGLDQPLFAYVESVSHRAAVQPATGTETAGAVITFSRGLIGIEDVRKTSVPLTNQVGGKGGTRAANPPQAPASAPIAPEEAPKDIRSAGLRAVAKAREIWLQQYINPNASQPHPETLALLNSLLRTEEGCGGTWLNAASDFTLAEYLEDQKKTEQQNRYTDYCGCFAATCWRAAGLQFALRRVYWASTGRLRNYARYIQQDKSTLAAAALTGWPQQNDDQDRKILELTAYSKPADVLAFDPQPGDILLIGSTNAGPGSHVALVESYNATAGMFTTYEGNGAPKGAGSYPDGRLRTEYGVVHRTRPVGKQSGYDAWVRYIIRPSMRDLAPGL